MSSRVLPGATTRLGFCGRRIAPSIQKALATTMPVFASRGSFNGAWIRMRCRCGFPNQFSHTSHGPPRQAPGRDAGPDQIGSELQVPSRDTAHVPWSLYSNPRLDAVVRHRVTLVDPLSTSWVVA